MAKNNLFTWKRSQTLGSGGRKHNSEVQTWIKKMQAESDNATVDAYGDVIPDVNDIGLIQPDDQAIYEAQELLDKWMQDKHMSNLNMELEFKDENWCASTKPLLNTNNDSEFYSLSEDGHIVTHNPLKVPETNRTSFSDVYDDVDIDYEEEANKMFKRFMSNSNVEDTIMSDLGMDKVTTKFRDPRPKMEQRHEMVKERNKERKEKMKNAKHERMMKKEAEILARKKIQEEEKSRQMKKQMEEAEIQKQMALIRKEMEDKKARANEEEKRKKKALKEAEDQIQFELRQKRILEKEEQERRKAAEEKMRQHIILEMEEKTLRETSDKMRILNKYFAAWYSVVAEHHVKVGKARAMFDWRCKLRAWKAWKAFVNHIKSSKEAEAFAVAMKIRYRKEQMAIRHFCVKTLRRCFVVWQSWGKEQQRLKEIKHQKEVNALRMAAFLDAAASGKLWNGDAKKLTRGDGTQRESIENTSRSENVDSKIDEIFQAAGRTSKPRCKDLLTKRPLSTSLNRQDQLNESSNQLQKSSGLKRTNEAFLDRTDNVDSQCNCPKTVERGRNEYIANKEEKGDAIYNKNKEWRPSKTNTNIKDTRRDTKDMITRLDLDCNDSDSEASSCLKDDVKDSKRQRDELVSRKPMVKSDRPQTKPTFLPMEERAKLRAEKKALMEEKRKIDEEQKLAQLRLEQEQLVLAEMQMKKDKLRKKREEERLRKEADIEKKRRQEEFQSLCRKADEHYRLKLLRKYGIQPWKNLIEIVKLNSQIATAYHSRLLFIKVMETWRDFTDESRHEKIQLANECYRVLLLRRCLNGWKKFGKHYDLLEDMARRHFTAVIVRKYFQYWQYYVTNERLALWTNEEKAESHDERRILKSSFAQWIAFIHDIKEERIRDKRKDELRKRVREWLPDFLS